MTLPILYSFRRCPYAMRARLAIAASGQQTHLREILLRDKAPEFLETSPKGTVPVLVLADGTVLEESLDVMDWALAQSDPQNLLPADSADKMRTLVSRCDTEFKPHLDRYKYASRHPEMDVEITLKHATEFLNELDAMLADTSFLFGETRTYADIGIAPFVRQFAHVNRVWFLGQPYKNVINWYSDFTGSTAFSDIMKKYPMWVAGDEVTVFPAS